VPGPSASDPAMVETTRQRGFDVVEDDAISCLVGPATNASAPWCWDLSPDRVRRGLRLVSAGNCHPASDRRNQMDYAIAARRPGRPQV
jgi:hypothetical protein